MKFPEDAPVTAGKRDELKARIATLAIDMTRVDEQAIRGSGPGGQKVNKTSSGVLLSYELFTASGQELIQVKWMRERHRSLNRYLALREMVDEVEERISPETSARLKERARIRKQKDRARRRRKP